MTLRTLKRRLSKASFKLYYGILSEYILDLIYDIESRLTIIKESIERFFFWGWAMRMNHDWDSEYLEDMILLKLKRMRTSVYHKGHLKWNPKSREYRALCECIHILETRHKIKTQFWKPNKIKPKIKLTGLDKNGMYDLGHVNKEDELHDLRMERFYELLTKWRTYWWD